MLVLLRFLPSLPMVMFEGQVKALVGICDHGFYKASRGKLRMSRSSFDLKLKPSWTMLGSALV